MDAATKTTHTPGPCEPSRFAIDAACGISKYTPGRGVAGAFAALDAEVIEEKAVRPAVAAALKAAGGPCGSACVQVIEERDSAESAIQAIHIALGGDGEWSSDCDLRREALELADSRLIAAAPDMLAALEDVVEFVHAPEADCTCHLAPPCGDCVDHACTREALAVARAAIAKAVSQ